MEEWPADIKLILDKLGINDFYVSGLSAGCVHAFTVAYAFKERILGIGVNTPTAPFSAENALTQMAPITKYLRIIMEYPYIGDMLAYLMSKMTAKQRMEAAPDVAKALNKMLRLKEPWMIRAYDGYISDQTRGVVKGHRGWCDNMYNINEDLPFPTNELDFVSEKGLKFVITSAKDDTTNPPRMQQYWAESIKGVEIIHREEGYGHLHGSVHGWCTKKMRERERSEVKRIKDLLFYKKILCSSK